MRTPSIVALRIDPEKPDFALRENPFETRYSHGFEKRQAPILFREDAPDGNHYCFMRWHLDHPYDWYWARPLMILQDEALHDEVTNQKPDNWYWLETPLTFSDDVTHGFYMSNELYDLLIALDRHLFTNIKHFFTKDLHGRQVVLGLSDKDLRHELGECFEVLYQNTDWQGEAKEELRKRAKWLTQLACRHGQGKKADMISLSLMEFSDEDCGAALAVIFCMVLGAAG
jgi:hypothetical protein